MCTDKWIAEPLYETWYVINENYTIIYPKLMYNYMSWHKNVKITFCHKSEHWKRGYQNLTFFFNKEYKHLVVLYGLHVTCKELTYELKCCKKIVMIAFSREPNSMREHHKRRHTHVQKYNNILWMNKICWMVLLVGR